MILLIICLCGTALSHYLGVRNSGVRGRGTTAGWLLSLMIGVVLAGIFYGFSAFGLIVSLDTLFSDF